MYLLGYDIGSSSVKASLVDVQSGKCAATAFYPKTEAPIISHKPGWAEQDPAAWMEYLTLATKDVLAQTGATDIAAIGISYQMHGLVCVDRDRNVLRPAIIWCDSRAVPYGQAAFEAMGADYCLSHLLNSPGNFTAAKLAWVKENEPEIYARIWKVMLPGDYVAMRLTGSVCTTAGGLSEGIFWDFKEGRPSERLLDHFGGGCHTRHSVFLHYYFPDDCTYLKMPESQSRTACFVSSIGRAGVAAAECSCPPPPKCAASALAVTGDPGRDRMLIRVWPTSVTGNG